MPNKSNSGRTAKPLTLGSLGDNVNLKVPVLRTVSASYKFAIKFC